MIEIAQAIQSSIEIVGRLRELSKKVGDAEFKMLLADLSSELGDAKLEAANLKVALATALDEKGKLEERLAQRDASKPKLEDGVYRFEGEDGRFCTPCFDVHQRKVQVTPMSGVWREFGKWQCPSCQATMS